MEIKITRRQLIESEQNSMVYNHYWLIHGKFYDSLEHNYSRKFKFIIWLDLTYDLWDEEEQTDRPENDVIDEFIDSYLCVIPLEKINTVTDFMENDKFKHFYELCNESIEKYNDHVKRCMW